MAWQGKVAGLVGSAVVTVGFFATDSIKKIEANPTALYMAGQFWVMAGKRECGLELINRAGRASRGNNSAQTAPAPKVEMQMCSRQPKHEAMPTKAVQPRMVSAVIEPAPVRVEMPPTFVRVQASGEAPAPTLIAASFPAGDEFVKPNMLVFRDGEHVLDPGFEQRIRHIEAEARRRALEHHMTREQQRQLQREIRAFTQRG